jgi:hypothetical protein
MATKKATISKDRAAYEALINVLADAVMKRSEAKAAEEIRRGCVNEALEPIEWCA